MSRFYGRVQGGRGQATRCGDGKHGLRVVGQSYNGDVSVEFSADGDRDMVRICAGRHQSHGQGYGEFVIYYGPVAALLTQSGRETILQAISTDLLIELSQDGVPIEERSHASV